MSAINNLKGHPVKDGKIVHYEQIEPDLYFAVILMYEPFFNNNYAVNSSQLVCKSLITNGNKQTYSNGIIGLEEVKITETIYDNEKFKPLREELKTKDGFKVYQQDFFYQEHETQKEGKKIKVKTRKIEWLIEIPKQALLQYCITD